jgi:hypothetical protein
VGTVAVGAAVSVAAPRNTAAHASRRVRIKDRNAAAFRAEVVITLTASTDDGRVKMPGAPPFRRLRRAGTNALR